MLAVFLALWPLFALILFGFVLQRQRFLEQGFWAGAEKLNYFILFPALLVNSLAQTSFDSPHLFKLALVVALGLAAGCAVMLLCKRIFGWDNLLLGVWTQGALRFNTYLGLATVASLIGKEGLAIAALIIAIKVPLVNVISVSAFSVGRGISAKQLFLPVIKNPLILACLLGIALNVSGIGLPFGFSGWFSMLGAASLPLGMLCVGAALRPASLLCDRTPLVFNALIKLTLMPFIVALLAHWLGLPALESLLLVIFFALPTASSSYILTRQMGGNGELMAGVVTLQTLLAVFTLPLTLWLLG